MALPESVNNSYALCDNIYHTVNVRRSSAEVEMDVDRKNSVKSNITDGELNGTVYVGGIPSKDVTMYFENLQSWKWKCS
jgi:hypothetical protein